MPEDLFWKTMNPARLVPLYNSHFTLTANQGQRQAEEKPQKTSLYEYLTGGGG